MSGERQLRRGVAGKRESPRVNRLGDPARIVRCVTREERRDVDEVASDVTDDEIAALWNREAT